MHSYICLQRNNAERGELQSVKTWKRKKLSSLDIEAKEFFIMARDQESVQSHQVMLKKKIDRESRRKETKGYL